MTAIAWSTDVARYGTISFTMTETGGGGASGTVSISSGFYSLTGTTFSAVKVPDPQTGEVTVTDFGDLSLIAEVQSQMNAIGNATYTVTLDIATSRPRFTLAGGGVTSVAISAMSTQAKRSLGWDNAASVATGATHQASWDPWHTCIFANGGASEWTETEADIAGEDLIGSDGSRRGLVAVGASRLLDLVVPLEPIASIYDENAASLDDRTWQRTLRRVRTHEMASIVNPKVSGALIGYLRADSCVLRPRLMAADYLAYQSIPLGFHIIGWT